MNNDFNAYVFHIYKNAVRKENTHFHKKKETI